MPDLSLGESSQAGDVNVGDMAGGDIYHGANADNVLALLKYQIDKQSQFNMLLVNSIEKQHDALERHQASISIKLRLLRLIVSLLLFILALELWRFI